MSQIRQISGRIQMMWTGVRLSPVATRNTEVRQRLAHGVEALTSFWRLAYSRPVQPGSVPSGSFTADGSGGAKHVGIFDSGGGSITSATISATTDFAVDQLAWAAASGPLAGPGGS